MDDDELLAYLGHELARNYVQPGALAAIFDDLGVPLVANYLRKNKFPTDVSVRHGDFGEALTGALFRRVRRWCVPVLKLRYKHRPNQAVQGCDVLAFRLRADPPVVAVPEVKTRSAKDLGVGREAHESLESVLQRLDESISFVFERLVENHNALAKHVGRLLMEPYEVARHIVLVHDRDRWDDRVVERLVAVASQPIEVTVIRLPELKDLVQRAYTAAEASPRRAAVAAQQEPVSND
ncbi:Hachiman antiphage defense system protein HamA [Dactylosporangium salmoneum]|uniref:Hachiman antiphage defense system protein HamA n=1 Tax=Dactylosporangium salmoneum TaxID=53361 RepID=UPI0031D5D932